MTNMTESKISGTPNPETIESKPRKWTPKEILEGFYKAEYEYTVAVEDERDFSKVAAFIAPDYYMEQTSALPWAGEWRGRSGMQRWMETVSSWMTIDVRDADVFEAQDPTSDRIVVLSRFLIKGKKTGKEAEFPLSQTVVVDRDEGVIREIRPFYWDPTAVNEVLGYKR